MAPNCLRPTHRQCNMQRVTRTMEMHQNHPAEGEDVGEEGVGVGVEARDGCEGSNCITTILPRTKRPLRRP